MIPQLKNISALETICLESPNNDTAVVMLHGYGASMNDLMPLWEMWHQPNFNWYFPNGVLALPMGYYEGRAWFPIDMAKLQDAINKGIPRDMAGSVPEHFDETITVLQTFLNELKTRHKKIIVGGFSQGAMCASHLAVAAGSVVDGVVLMSGNLVAESKFPKAAKSVPFYQSHGVQDPVLSAQGAKELETKLLNLGFQGKLVTFQGGHEIPMSVINGVKTFLTQFHN